MKCMHKQFTVKSVGGEWPRGVKESVEAVRNTVILAWYAVLANIIQVLQTEVVAYKDTLTQ